MKIHRISVPTPFYVGPVNVYLIDEEPLTLIDAGPRTEEAIVALRSGLARLGRRLSDVKRIIVTHAHADHYGLTRLIREESGAQVFVHSWDARAVAETEDYGEYKNLLTEAGVPSDILERMEKGWQQITDYADAVSDVDLLEDEDEIVFEHESLRVLHTPGHTPGSICLVRASDRTVFASDTVLKNITPNPVLNPDPVNRSKRFQSLGEYLVSLARLRSISPTLLKGGHGEDVTDFEEHFNRMYHFHRTRQNNLMELVPRPGGTAWELSLRLFPDAKSYHRFLALSETAAHLDFAVSEDRLIVERRNGQDVYFRP
jgi:glyoxylase-like metal-dependent hydrolase (beta-lactamase superfamily II)